jgi:hypothetical protein
MAAFDYMGYNQRKRAAQGTYGAATARNAYAQFLSQQRGSRKKFDLQQGYERQTPGVIGSFTKRGLAGPGVKSGIFQRGMTDFATKQFQDMADLNRAQDEEMQQLQFEDRQTRAEYDQQIAELESQKQAAIAQAAATLSAFKPFIGG